MAGRTGSALRSVSPDVKRSLAVSTRCLPFECGRDSGLLLGGDSLVSRTERRDRRLMLTAGDRCAAAWRVAAAAAEAYPDSEQHRMAAGHRWPSGMDTAPTGLVVTLCDHRAGLTAELKRRCWALARPSSGSQPHRRRCPDDHHEPVGRHRPRRASVQRFPPQDVEQVVFGLGTCLLGWLGDGGRREAPLLPATRAASGHELPACPRDGCGA